MKSRKRRQWVERGRRIRRTARLKRIPSVESVMAATPQILSAWFVGEQLSAKRPQRRTPLPEKGISCAPDSPPPRSASHRHSSRQRPPTCRPPAAFPGKATPPHTSDHHSLCPPAWPVFVRTFPGLCPSPLRDFLFGATQVPRGRRMCHRLREVGAVVW